MSISGYELEEEEENEIAQLRIEFFYAFFKLSIPKKFICIQN